VSGIVDTHPMAFPAHRTYTYAPFAVLGLYCFASGSLAIFLFVLNTAYSAALKAIFTGREAAGDISAAIEAGSGDYRSL